MIVDALVVTSVIAGFCILAGTVFFLFVEERNLLAAITAFVLLFASVYGIMWVAHQGVAHHHARDCTTQHVDGVKIVRC
jgi:hypothetical protein